MHYTFDKWMEKEHPHNPWARYADDAVTHCRTKEEAEQLLEQLRERFAQCKLELHPDKTRIVYCKDDDRKGDLQRSNSTFWDTLFGRGDRRIGLGNTSSTSRQQ
jgi:RNA-directed DNA polymerase